MMKRQGFIGAVGKAVFLAAMAILLVAVPVLAYTYYTTIQVAETGGNNYAYLPYDFTIDNDYLAQNGYMSDNALDTQVLEGITQLQHMVADNKTLFVAPSINAFEQHNYKYTTGNAFGSDFPVIVGNNGYIMVCDNTQLELGANFTVDQRGYLDVAMADQYLVDKNATFRVYPGGGNLVYAEILGGGQPIVGGYNDALNPAATEYNSLMGGFTWNAAESSRYQCIPTGGTISELYVRLSANVGAGATYTFTLMVDSVASVLAVTIPAGQSTGSDLTHVVSVAAGQTVSIRSTFTGAPGAPTAQWTTHWNGTVPEERICLISMNSDNLATRYGEIQGAVGAGSVTETQVQAPIPISGSFLKLYVKLSADPGTAPDAYSFTLMRNGVAQPLTCTVTADNTTGSDTVNEVSFNAGQLVDIRIVPLNAPAIAPSCAVGMVYRNGSYSLIMGGSWADQPTINATEYNNLCGAGNGVWVAAEASAYSLIQETLLERLYVKLDAAPGGAASYTVSIREGVGNTGLTVTITGAATTGNDVVNTYISSEGDVADTKCVTTAGAAVARVHWGLACQDILVQAFTAASVTTGVRRVVATADGINLTVSVYDAGGGLLTSGSTPLGSATVPDTAQFWLIDQGNVMPYMDYLQITTAIAPAGLKLWFQPVDYVHGQPYFMGTAVFINGFDSIGGMGTAWTSAMEGSVIWSDIDRISCTVLSVENPTFLYLTTPYMGAGGMGHNYTMLPRLPDRDIVDGYHDGGIVWGTNPAGLAYTVGGLVSTSQPAPTGVAPPESADIIPEIEQPGWFTTPTGGDLASEIFFPYVSWLSTAVPTITGGPGFTPYQIYLIIAIAIWFCVVGLAAWKIPHMLFAGIMGMAVAAFFVSYHNLFPWWVLIISGFFLFATIVFERKPMV